MSIQMPSAIRSFAIFTGALFIALLVFYSSFLCGARSFYLGDISFFFEPLLNFISRSFRSGQVPLWNPLSYCGMPQIAIPSPGIFYPFTLLFALLPFNAALAMTMILHQLIAGAGAFVLISSLGWGRFAACAGGLAYALCGYMFALETNYTLVATASWLPWLALSLRRISASHDRANSVNVALCAAALFMMIMAGRPEVFVPAASLLFAIMLMDWLLKRQTQGMAALRVLLWQALSVVLGLMLAAPSIVPALEWTSLSPRHHGLDLEEVMRWSANWYHLLCMVMPQPLGDMTQTGAHFLPLISDFQGFSPYVTSTYLGPVVFSLALFALFDRQWRSRWLIAGALVVTLIFSMGKHGGIAPLLVSACPPLALIRYPSKMLIVPLALLCLMAARGANCLIERRISAAAEVTVAALWAILLTTSIFLSIHSPASAALSGIILGSQSDLAHEAGFLLANQGLTAAILGLLLSFAFNIYKDEKLDKRLFSSVVLATLAGTLLYAGSLCQHGTEPGYFDERGELAAKLDQLAKEDAKAGNQYRVLATYTLLKPCPPQYTKLQGIDADAALHQYNRFLLHPNAHLDSNVASAFGYETAETEEYKDCFLQVMSRYNLTRAPGAGNTPPPDKAIDDRALAAFCQLTATKYVLTLISTPTAGGIYQLPAPDGRYFSEVWQSQDMNVRIHALRDALPRAYLCETCEAVSTDLKKLLVEERPKGADLRQQCYVSTADAEAVSAQMPPQAVLQLTEPASLIWKDSATPEHLQIAVNTPRTRIVVLTDHFYPGWTAHVDTTAAPILRVNVFNRGVVVPQGSHTVRFDYEPASLRIGLALSALALLTLLLLPATALARRKTS